MIKRATRARFRAWYSPARSGAPTSRGSSESGTCTWTQPVHQLPGNRDTTVSGSGMARRNVAMQCRHNNWSCAQIFMNAARWEITVYRCRLALTAHSEQQLRLGNIGPRDHGNANHTWPPSHVCHTCATSSTVPRAAENVASAYPHRDIGHVVATCHWFVHQDRDHLEKSSPTPACAQSQR